MRRFPKAWIAAAILVAAGACGSDDPTSPIAGASGTWNLQSINGSALPVTIGTGTQAVTVIASTLTISTNGNYNEVVTLRPAGTTSNTTFTETGTWSVTNGVVTFNDQTDGITYNGTVSGNTLTETTTGFVSVYARQ
jgi:Lipocalin-like domain